MSRDVAAEPRVFVVMGVSGSGKSTVAALLAKRLGCTVVDGDALHAPAAIAKMRCGASLDDADRAPWLGAIGAWIDAQLAARRSGVIACSALKRAYRTTLTTGRPAVRIVYLSGDEATIAGRLAARRGHFMPPILLPSQFADLEPPGPEERPIVVSIADAPEAMVEAILARLGRDGPDSC